jgi:stage V sporulation protein K
MIFKGNPGTGKTTVARMIGKIFKELGVLNKGHLVEVERADLVGEYIGHTAKKTREQLKKALGGVLFIDEAYSLARGGEKDFGREAIDCLVKGMEDHREEFILILAGYRDEMEFFIRSNPGLRSRFSVIMEFPDYSLEELMKIACLMFHQKQYRLTLEAKVKLEKILCKWIFSGYNRNGNARLARIIAETAIRRQAYRLMERGMELHRDNLLQITAEDLLEPDQPVFYSQLADQEQLIWEDSGIKEIVRE